MLRPKEKTILEMLSGTQRTSCIPLEERIHSLSLSVLDKKSECDSLRALVRDFSAALDNAEKEFQDDAVQLEKLESKLLKIEGGGNKSPKKSTAAKGEGRGIKSKKDTRKSEKNGKTSRKKKSSKKRRKDRAGIKDKNMIEIESLWTSSSKLSMSNDNSNSAEGSSVDDSSSSSALEDTTNDTAVAETLRKSVPFNRESLSASTRDTGPSDTGFEAVGLSRSQEKALTQSSPSSPALLSLSSSSLMNQDTKLSDEAIARVTASPARARLSQSLPSSPARQIGLSSSPSVTKRFKPSSEGIARVSASPSRARFGSSPKRAQSRNSRTERYTREKQVDETIDQSHSQRPKYGLRERRMDSSPHRGIATSSPKAPEEAMVRVAASPARARLSRSLPSSPARRIDFSSSPSVRERIKPSDDAMARGSDFPGRARIYYSPKRAQSCCQITERDAPNRATVAPSPKSSDEAKARVAASPARARLSRSLPLSLARQIRLSSSSLLNQRIKPSEKAIALVATSGTRARVASTPKRGQADSNMTERDSLEKDVDDTIDDTIDESFSDRQKCGLRERRLDSPLRRGIVASALKRAQSGSPPSQRDIWGKEVDDVIDQSYSQRQKCRERRLGSPLSRCIVASSPEVEQSGCSKPERDTWEKDATIDDLSYSQPKKCCCREMPMDSPLRRGIRKLKSWNSPGGESKRTTKKNSDALTPKKYARMGLKWPMVGRRDRNRNSPLKRMERNASSVGENSSDIDFDDDKDSHFDTSESDGCAADNNELPLCPRIDALPSCQGLRGGLVRTNSMPTQRGTSLGTNDIVRPTFSDDMEYIIPWVGTRCGAAR